MNRLYDMTFKIKIQKMRSYDKDHRMQINDIYNNFSKLNENNWQMEIIYEKENLPIIAFKTKKQGKALWLIAGVHGEEPAGPNAIAENIKFLNNLAKKIPIVLIPLCNPRGYSMNWRYPYMKYLKKDGSYQSVGDAEPFLPSINDTTIPNNKKIILEAKAICEYIIKTSKTHPPILSLDFHEDDSKTGAYIYSQSKLGPNDPIANEIVSILKKAKFKFYNKNRTRFNQPIINGIVSDPHDNSLDELIASKKVFLNNKPIKGPSAKSVIVIETNTPGVLLNKRVKTHSDILKSSLKFYKTIERV